MNLFYVRLFTQPFRDPATDLPLSGGLFSVKLAGTNTNATTYTTATGTSNSNPATLDVNGAGVFYFDPTNGGVACVDYDIYVYAADDTGLTTPLYTYEDISVPVSSDRGNATAVVLGYGSPSSLTIAGGSITPTKNDHHISPEGGSADNLDDIDVTALPDGAPLYLSNTNGSAPITVRSGIGNIFTSDGSSIVLSATTQRQLFIRDGSNWFAVGPSTAPIIANDVCDGRLTVTSGTPVVDSGSTSTFLYFTPFKGNRIALYSSGVWQVLTFTELQLATNTFTQDKPTDIWIYNNGGVAALDSTVWTSAFVRATALATQDGVYVKSGAPTRRYLGTIYATAGNIIQDAPAFRHCWNYQNRVARRLLIQETISITSSYNTATWRQANGNTTNQITSVIGVIEDTVDLHATSLIATGTAGDRAYVGIAFGSAGTPSTQCLGVSSTSTANNGFVTAEADYKAFLSGPGLWTFIWEELGSASGTLTWYYAISVTSLPATGLHGILWG